MLELAIEVDETDVEFGFGDVNAERWCCHGDELLFVGSDAARVKLADASSAHG
jgi:hypothetical protein